MSSLGSASCIEGYENAPHRVQSSSLMCCSVHVDPIYSVLPVVPVAQPHRLDAGQGGRSLDLRASLKGHVWELLYEHQTSSGAGVQRDDQKVSQ